jgi:putative hydrolase of the HAD superfamily
MPISTPVERVIGAHTTSVAVARGVSRAIVFDLDETLYRERRFALSGCSAVSDHLEATRRIPREATFRFLASALRGGRRPQMLQDLCARFELSTGTVAELVNVIRTHRPRLRLQRHVLSTLVALRSEWRLALLTNGIPAIQGRKVDALNLRPCFDVIAFASEHGDGSGKPEPEPFRHVLGELELEADRCVFVGDDPRCDIHGARRLGMHTIRVRRPQHAAESARPSREADIVVSGIDEIPDAAFALLNGVAA